MRIKTGVEQFDVNDWRLKAECRGLDTNMFFYEEWEQGQARQAVINLAQLICSECVVRTQCSNFAEETGEEYGIWGGQDVYEPRRQTDLKIVTEIPDAIAS